MSTNFIFNELISFLDAHGLISWSATAQDDNNIRALNILLVLKNHSDITADNSPSRSRGGFGTKSTCRQMKVIFR